MKDKVILPFADLVKSLAEDKINSFELTPVDICAIKECAIDTFVKNLGNGNKMIAILQNSFDTRDIQISRYLRRMLYVPTEKQKAFVDWLKENNFKVRWDDVKNQYEITLKNENNSENGTDSETDKN